MQPCNLSSALEFTYFHFLACFTSKSDCLQVNFIFPVRVLEWFWSDFFRRVKSWENSSVFLLFLPSCALKNLLLPFKSLTESDLCIIGNDTDRVILVVSSLLRKYSTNFRKTPKFTLFPSNLYPIFSFLMTSSQIVTYKVTRFLKNSPIFILLQTTKNQEGLISLPAERE